MRGREGERGMCVHGSLVIVRGVVIVVVGALPWFMLGRMSSRSTYYVDMYVCMYVRTYVRTYVCMHVCMYVCMYVCVYVCMCCCGWCWCGGYVTLIHIGSHVEHVEDHISVLRPNRRKGA